MPERRQDLPILPFASAEAWERWLEENHAEAAGVWVKFAKKGSGTPTVSTKEAIEVALCFGWVDGQLAPYDEAWWLVRYTPRQPRSKWSQLNRERATRLATEGRMRTAGAREVELAQADGRWDAAYAPQSTASVPDDLAAALAANPEAAAFFATLNRVNRYAILYRIDDAKRADTRAKRIEKFVQMLARGERLHP